MVLINFIMVNISLGPVSAIAPAAMYLFYKFLNFT